MRTSMTIVFHLTFACNDNNFNIHLIIIDQSDMAELKFLWPVNTTGNNSNVFEP